MTACVGSTSLGFCVTRGTSFLLETQNEFVKCNDNKCKLLIKLIKFCFLNNIFLVQTATIKESLKEKREKLEKKLPLSLQNAVDSVSE